MAAKSDKPEEMRRLIVERLVGATGEPAHVVEAARSMALRALPTVQEMLAGKFARPVPVDLGAVDIVRLAALKPEPESFDVLMVLSAPTAPEALTLRLDPQALSLLVATLFGGDPDLPPPPLERAPSRIELDVAAMVLESFAHALNGTGPRALGLRVPFPRPVAGPGPLKRLVVRDGPGVRITFTIGTGASAGYVTAWMPQRVALEERGGRNARAVGEMAGPAWQQRFGEEVMRSRVALSATIPLARMPLGALTDLSVGQVLELEESAPGSTRLSVRGRPVFVCEFGKLGQHYTVRVKKRFDARENVLDNLLADNGRDG